MIYLYINVSLPKLSVLAVRGANSLSLLLGITYPNILSLTESGKFTAIGHIQLNLNPSSDGVPNTSLNSSAALSWCWFFKRSICVWFVLTVFTYEYTCDVYVCINVWVYMYMRRCICIDGLPTELWSTIMHMVNIPKRNDSTNKKIRYITSDACPHIVARAD